MCLSTEIGLVYLEQPLACLDLSSEYNSNLDTIYQATNPSL